MIYVGFDDWNCGLQTVFDGCVAQVVRALCSHRRGHKFKSCHTYQ